MRAAKASTAWSPNTHRLCSHERSRVQDDFVAGRIRGVFATTAFGMGIDKPDVRFVCLFNYPDSLESYVQMVGRAGRDGKPSDTLLLASPSDATAVRKFALGDIPTPDDLRRVYRVLRDSGGVVEPEDLPGGQHDSRVLVGMLEQAGIVRRGCDQGRAMSVELLEVGAGAGAVLDDLLARYAEQASERVERIVRFAGSSRCRHAQVAEHFGELLEPPCGACDVCAPRRHDRAAAKAVAALPDDVGGAIVAAVQALRWPLGRRSLVAMLRGSVSAPPSARASAGFGLLAAATDAEAKRWVRALEDAGALVEIETDDGYRVLQAVAGRTLPSIGPNPGAPVDDELLTRLRSWRLERSRADGVPAYVVLHDSMLRDLASARPTTRHELAAVKGFGPARIERYGDEVLELVGAA